VNSIITLTVGVRLRFRVSASVAISISITISSIITNFKLNFKFGLFQFELFLSMIIYIVEFRYNWFIIVVL